MMGNDRTRLMLVVAGYVGFATSLVLPVMPSAAARGIHFLLSSYIATFQFFLREIANWSGDIPSRPALVVLFMAGWTHTWILTSWVHWFIRSRLWRVVHAFAGLGGVLCVAGGWLGLFLEPQGESLPDGLWWTLWHASILIVALGMLARASRQDAATR